MESSNPLQQLLVRGIGTTNVVADRLKSVIQGWVTSGSIDASQASSLIEEVSGAMRGDNPAAEKQAEQQIERNLDQLLHEMGLARQREVDELRGRIDRLEQQLRQNGELR